MLPADRLQLSSEFTTDGGVLGLSGTAATGEHVFSGSVPSATDTIAGEFTNRYFEGSSASLPGDALVRVYNSPSTSTSDVAPDFFARLTMPTMNGSGTSNLMISNLRCWLQMYEADTSSNPWSGTITYSQYDVVELSGEYWYSETNGNLNNTPSDSSVNWNRLSRDEITFQIEVRNGATVLATIDGPMDGGADSWGRELPEYQNIITGIISNSANIGSVATGANIDLYLKLSLSSGNGTVFGGPDSRAILAGFGVRRGTTTLTTQITVDNAAADGTGTLTFETTNQADTSYDVTL